MVAGVVVAANCQIILPIFGFLFLLVGCVLTGEVIRFVFSIHFVNHRFCSSCILPRPRRRRRTGPLCRTNRLYGKFANSGTSLYGDRASYAYRKLRLVRLILPGTSEGTNRRVPLSLARGLLPSQSGNQLKNLR